VPEGGREIVEELPREDVVLTVCLSEAKRLCIGGSTARPSGGGALSSPAPREMMFGCRRMKLDGLGSPVGRGSAPTALDQGSEVAWAADDGSQGLRRRSGKGLRSGRENAVD
jgi:hypothetical protein